MVKFKLENILCALAAVAGAFVAYCDLCIVSMLWIASQVPVTEQDLAWASWLFAVPESPFAGIVGYCLFLLALGLSVWLSLATKGLYPIAALLFCTGVMWCTSTTNQVRLGVLEDTVKVGCFVWETQECRHMLGAPVGLAPSMYVSPQIQRKTGQMYADWYQQKLETLRAEKDRPFGAFLSAPMYVKRVSELKAKMARQRTEVEQFQRANKSVGYAPGNS